MPCLVNPFVYGSDRLFTVTQYTGNGSTQNIVTGLNLTAGGMVWAKETGSTGNHEIGDSVRGANKQIYANLINAENSLASITAYNSDGFTVGTGDGLNASGDSLVAFSWLEDNTYFDVVTYTGNGSNRTVSHGLSVAPKLILVKRRDSASTDGLIVYHASNTGAPETDFLVLTDERATGDDNAYWNDTVPTSSVFSLGTAVDVNANSGTYVAYLFAEKAGHSKFGSYSGTTTITTGLPEINCFLVKRTDAVGDWYLFYQGGGTWYYIKPNSTAAQVSGLISVSGGDVTLSGLAAAGSGIYAAWR